MLASAPVRSNTTYDITYDITCARVKAVLVFYFEHNGNGVNMNKTQVQTTGASLAAMAAGFAAGRGWLGLDAAGWTTIFGAVFAAVAVVWPAVATRLSVIRGTVAASGDVVVTNSDAASAARSANVVASTPTIEAELAKQQR